MIITTISDTHQEFDKTLKKLRDFQYPDIYIIAGDSENLGVENYFKDEYKASDEFYSTLAKVAPVILVTGNHSLGMAHKQYTDQDVYNITDKELELFGLKFIGMNMTNAYDSPNLCKKWYNTTNREEVEEAYYEQFKEADIVVSHCPPFGPLGKIDRANIGSRPLLKYIEKYQPGIVVTGHVHETGGETQQIGDTLVVNSAQNIMQINIDLSIESELPLSYQHPFFP